MVTREITKSVKTIPVVKEAPLIGVMAEFNKDRLGLFLRAVREGGEAARYHFGPFSNVQFSKPELVQSVLVEHAYDFDKGPAMHNAFESIIGQGLFISEGNFHRKQRKLMAPSFQPRQVASYADTMVRYSEQLLQPWHSGEQIDVEHEMTALTMSIIGKVLFDADVFTETDGLGGAVREILNQVNYTLSHLFPIPLSWPLPRNRRVKRALAFLHERIQQMIEERRASVQERDDFLSILLRAQEEDGVRMSDKQIVDEALTLFAAGHETTATALTWAWYLLAIHPEAYRKVQQEVDSVLQGRLPTYADLTRLPYCLQVFKETMRLYPPAYAISRTALRDVDINGYSVAKGESAILGIYVIHRDPEFYPEPERFEPERFEPEKEKKLPRYAYMPFGAGSRICIGNHFAVMEGHLLLATLAQRVTFDLVPGQQIKPDPTKTLVLRPGHGVNMFVRRRIAKEPTAYSHDRQPDRKRL